MNYHKTLSSSRWSSLTLLDQMANIGSEIERAIKWKEKGNDSYASMANERALELFDLTLTCTMHAPALREIARARELWLDFFVGDNQYRQNTLMWRNYFYAFTVAARNAVKDIEKPL